MHSGLDTEPRTLRPSFKEKFAVAGYVRDDVGIFFWRDVPAQSDQKTLTAQFATGLALARKRTLLSLTRA